MDIENKTFKDKRTNILIKKNDLNNEEEVLPSRYVYNVKRIGLKKASLVAGGHHQRYSCFEHSDSSSTASPETNLLFISESMKLEGTQNISIDFKGA